MKTSILALPVHRVAATLLVCGALVASAQSVSAEEALLHHDVELVVRLFTGLGIIGEEKVPALNLLMAHWGLAPIDMTIGSTFAPNPTPGSEATLAACLAERNTKLYATSWCPFCAQQRELFEDSADLLPYVECSGEDGQETEMCREAAITAYPTWEFGDGTRLMGVQPLEVVAEQAGCVYVVDEFSDS